MPMKTSIPYPKYKDTTLYIYEFDETYDHWFHYEVVTRRDDKTERIYLDFSKYQTLTESLYHMMVDLNLPTRYDVASNGPLYPEDVEIAWTLKFGSK